MKAAIGSMGKGGFRPLSRCVRSWPAAIRALYLAWLLCAQHGEIEEGELEGGGEVCEVGSQGS